MIRPLTQVLLGLLIVLLPAFLLIGSPDVSGTPALAESGSPTGIPSARVPTETVDIEECYSIRQPGISIKFECVDKDGAIIPNSRITLDPDDIKTEFIPGPTVTVRPPPPPAPPRATVTVTERPRVVPQPPRETITVTPAPRTVTITPEPRIVPGPTETVTETPAPDTPDRTRQPDTNRGTINEDEPIPDADHALTFPQWSVSAPEAVGLGTLSILLLMLLILVGMWLGYYMGYKDSDKADAKFLRSLLGK